MAQVAMFACCLVHDDQHPGPVYFAGTQNGEVQFSLLSSAVVIPAIIAALDDRGR